MRFSSEPPYSSVRSLVNGEMNDARRYPCAMWISSRSNPASSARRRRRRIRRDLLHVFARHLARHRAAVRKVGKRGRRDERPSAFAAAARCRLPTSAASHPCGRRDRAECQSLPGSRDGRNRRRASTRRRARGDRARRTRVRCGHRRRRRSSPPSRGRRRQWRGCPGARRASRRPCRCRRRTGTSGDTTTRFGITRSRSRNGVNIGGGMRAGVRRGGPSGPPRRTAFERRPVSSARRDAGFR